MLKLEAKKAAVLGGLLIATLAIIFWITGESAAPQGQKNTEAAPGGAGNGAGCRGQQPE